LALSFTKKIQSFGGRRNVNASGNATGLPQGSVLSPILLNMYKIDAHQSHGVHLALFADDSSLYATDRKKGFVV
jgi:retron-type reverse transcriptase